MVQDNQRELTIGELARKLGELVALIERAELVKTWLAAAAACECPSLEDCPLFHDVGHLERAGRSSPAVSRAGG